MMKCPTCGARYSASERLCPNDGAVLEQEQPLRDQLIGKTLDGKYRIESFISRGGMGAVFRGTHVMLNRPVAVKMINANLVTSPEIVRRFQREARAATHLNHPNIVDVYDLGQTSDGTLYIVMELVSGESLKHAIKAHGAMDPRRIVHILGQVCDGLGVAHRANIVHRDLKPQNIMLTRDRNDAEVAKIVDFGIAKTLELDANTQLTADGATLGTPHYMSPEQANGQEVDGRSDIYSLGIILYEMLTGEVPFDDKSLPALLIKQMSEPPTLPSQRRPDLAIPPAMEAIALRCLAKEPAARYATAEEMGAALTAALTIRTGDATAPVNTSAAAYGDATIPSAAPATASARPSVGVPPVPEARPATHPTAPAVNKPVHVIPPPSAPVTSGSSRGAFVLVAVLLFLLTAAGAASYWMWSRSQGGATESPIPTTDVEPTSEAPATSPAAGTTPSTEGSSAGAKEPAAIPPAAPSAAASMTRTAPTIERPAAAAPTARESQSSDSIPSAQARGAQPLNPRAPTSSASATSPAPSVPSSPPSARSSPPRQAMLPENPTISFQCRGAAEICTPLRSEMQIAFDRAGMSIRRAGADVNITAEVTQTDESPQRSFGADFYVRTYAVQLDAEAPRFDSEEIGMPNTPPVRADSRVGADRFNEYARMVAPEVVERVRAFWQKQRQ